MNGLFLYIREELLLEKGKAKKKYFLKGFIQLKIELNVPLVQKNILWTPMELKPYFQKEEKDMVSGMKMLWCGMDSRLGIANSVWGSGRVSRSRGKETGGWGKKSEQRLSGPWDNFKWSKHM